MAALPFDDDGLLAYADAAALGRGSELESLHRAGRLRRVRHGVYCAADGGSAAPSRAERDAHDHRLLVRAAARSMRAAIFTSWSAVALLELPIVGSWPREVYRLAPGPTGSRRPGVVEVAHRRRVDAVAHAGCLITPPEFSLVQLARHAPLLTALTAVDAALHEPRFGASAPMTTLEHLWAEHERLLPYHRSRRVAAVLERAAPGSEGPLETLSRLTIEELGFATPELQKRLWLPAARRTAYLDFWWPGVKVAGEADGRGKYLGADHDGQDVVSAVLREKNRKDAVREEVAAFIRWDWADAWERVGLERKLLRAGVPRPRRPRRLR